MRSPAWRVVVCVPGRSAARELSDVLRQGHEVHTLCITLDVACSDAFDANFRNALS